MYSTPAHLVCITMSKHRASFHFHTKIAFILLVALICLHFDKMPELPICHISALGSCMPLQLSENWDFKSIQPHSELIRQIGSSGDYQECKQIQATKSIYCIRLD